jgi:hypothetical protein
MNPHNGAGSAMAGSAAGKPRLTPDHRLAEHMAEGCPTVIEASRRMRLTAVDGERIWKRIVRALGWQAS